MHPYLDGPYPRAYAHRGWHIDDLAGCENTLAGFRRAVAEGYSYLELDVHATADGVVVVHHDTMLDRTTDATGPLAARTAAQLAEVRVRGRELIPHLADVLEELPETRVTIELKSAAAVGPLIELITRTGATGRVCVGGFEQTWMDHARRLGGPGLLTSMAKRDALGLRSRAWAEALPGPLRRVPTPRAGGGLAQLPRRVGRLTVVDAALLRVAHRSGREVHVWTVDDAAEMAELLDLGVDGLLTDRPDILRSVLVQRGQWVG